MIKMSRLALFSMALLIPSLAWASGDIRVLPAGIVAPGFGDSILQNPATLAYTPGTDLELLYTPTTTYTGNVAWANSTYGIGGGYTQTNYPGSAYMTQDAYGAFGYRNGNFGIGGDYTLPVGTSYSGAGELAVGANFGNGKETNYALVFNNLGSFGSLGSFGTLSAGVGYIEPKKFNLELNLTLPPFATGFFASGSTYSLLAAGCIYAGSFGFGFTASYSYSFPTSGSSSPSYTSSTLYLPLSYTAAVSFQPDKFPTLSARFLGSGITFAMDFLL